MNNGRISYPNPWKSNVCYLWYINVWNGGMEYEPRDVLERVFSCAYDDIDIMAREIYIKAILNEDEIISLIEPKLKNWEFKRLNLISQAILLAAISEANYAKISDKKL